MITDEFVEMTFVQGGLHELREGCKVSNKDSITKSEYLKERLEILKEQIDEIHNSRKEICEGADNQDDEIIALNQREHNLLDEINNIFENFCLKIPVYSFSIATYPTTQDQWLEIMGDNPSHFKGKKNPVENIKWLDALEYCNRLSEKVGLQKSYEISEDEVTFEVKAKLIDSANGYRLPNHVQWAFAASGGRRVEEQNKFLEVGSLNDIGWFYDSFDKEETFMAYFRKAGTQPVGKKKPNILGIYDIFGNVNELCWDHKWTFEYAKYIENAIVNKIKITETNGSESGDLVYALGGSWNMSSYLISINSFGQKSPLVPYCKYLVGKSESSDDTGFRVVLPNSIK